MGNDPTLATFIVASIILAITPGPGVIYIVTRTLSQGRQAGLASVAGIALGNGCSAAAASVGVAAVLAASATAFMLVKFAGAAYLVFLGIKTLCRGNDEAKASPTTRVPAIRVFRDGFFVALLNPKTALFFAALLPQFITSSGPPLGQSLFLSSIFVLIAMATDTIYVLTASRIAPKIGRRWRAARYARYVTAATFIGLGVCAALISPRSEH